MTAETQLVQWLIEHEEGSGWALFLRSQGADKAQMTGWYASREALVEALKQALWRHAPPHAVRTD